MTSSKPAGSGAGRRSPGRGPGTESPAVSPNAVGAGEVGAAQAPTRPPLDTLAEEPVRSRPKVVEKIGYATGQGDGTVWFPTTGQVLPIAPSKEETYGDYSHGPSLKDQEVATQMHPLKEVEKAAAAKAAKDLVARLEEEAEKAEKEEAAIKASIVRTPFALACDEMVKVLADTQAMFTRRFRLPARVPILNDKFLVFHKHGKLGRILGVEGFESKGVVTPILSCNLEYRLATVDLIEDLWNACVAADEEALQRVLASNIKLKTFNTATAILDKAFCTHTAKAVSVLPNTEEWES